MKKINFIFIAFILFLSTIQNYGWIISFIFFILYGKKVKLIEILILFILLLRLFIPMSNAVLEDDLIQGKVISVSKSALIVRSGNVKYQIITQNKACLDDEVLIQIEKADNQDSSHFYSFDYLKYQKEKGISDSFYGKKLEIIQQGKTIRSFLHRKILLYDEQIQDLYLKLLLNQSGTDLTLLQCGFHLLFIIQLIDKILCSLLDIKKAKKIKMGILLCFLFFYHFPISLIRIFLIELFKEKMDKKTILALYTIFLYLINPALLHSVSYIIPVGLSLLDFNKAKRMLFLIVVQSFYFYECSWIKLFFFNFFNRLNGLLTLVGFYDVLCNQSLLSRFYPWMIQLDAYCNLNYFKGVGKLPVFFILFFLYSLYGKNDRKLIYSGLLTCFCLLQFNLVSFFGEVSFINVGQGDCIFIHLPLAQGTILIDTGQVSSYQHLKSFLKAKGVKKIDYLILTHDDNDHAGAKIQLCDDFDVKESIEQYRNELKLQKLTLTFLSPQSDYGNKNDNSLVSAFSINGLDFLLLADISDEVEEEICNQYGKHSFDFVKLAHHGSKTSTSISLLKHFDFRYAIISSGVNNRYHHPSDEVLKRLKAFGISVLNTQIRGDITITMTTFYNFILTSNQEFVIMKKGITE